MGSAFGLVIFDLDKTLARVNVSFAFGKYLYQIKKLGLWPMLSLVSAYGLHKLGLLPVDALHQLAFRLIFSKRSHASISADIQAFLRKMEPTLFRKELVSLLQEAKATNQLVWIQSSSPECLVKPIAEQLGVQTVFASRYLVHEDGAFLGVQEVVNGEAKRKLLEQFLEKNLLSRSEVTAYTDSILDLPLLEGVGKAVVVHPDNRLKKIARERSWHIWEEEKR